MRVFDGVRRAVWLLTRAGTATPCFEALEPRLLMAGDLLSVDLIEADNRGRVVVRLTRDLDQSTINSNSVQITTAGSDGIFGSADDTVLSSNTLYDAATRRLTVTASVAADTRYHFRLDSSILRDSTGGRLDGEFRGGSTISGDGVAGGDLVVFTRRAAQVVARMTTINGVIDVNLFADRTPLTVRNFQNYANRGVWDSTFFHRGVTNFVVQAGGFTNASGFANIPTDPPVQNEPGISNLRGTIAVAKLGSNPNSGTNQWFFNLADNSANLNAQNGGFTVFGEIRDAQGLSVVDAIAALERFSAAAQNSAFTDVPVQNLSVVQARGSLAPSDTASFSRVAFLVDLQSEPTQQLPTGGSMTVAPPAGQGQGSVTLLDLDQTGAVGNGSFMRVVFGRSSTISQIQIMSNPGGRVGIVINGATSITSVVDMRRGALSGDIAFIVSSAPIGSVRLASSLSGFNLNGFALPGLVMPEDIDGDGDLNDRTALVAGLGATAGAAMTTLTLPAGVRGDVVIPRGVGSVMVMGQTSGADFELGSRGSGTRGTAFTFGRVADAEIRSADPITSLRATEWLDTGARASVLRAPSISSLVITGDRRSGSAGNLEAGLTLTSTGQSTPILPSVNVAGSVLGSRWTVPGAVGPVMIRGDASDWGISGATSIGHVVVGNVTNGNLTTTGELRRLTAGTWDKGSISARTAGILSVNGDFNANLTLNAGGQTNILSSLVVSGSSTNSTMTFNGPVPTITIRGASDNLFINSSAGGVGTVNLGAATSTRIATGSSNLTLLNASSFENGQITGNIVFTANITGSFSGEFRPTFFNSLVVNGDFSGSINSRIGNILRVMGNVVSSTITFTQQFQQGSTSSNTLEIGGQTSGSEIRSTGSLGAVAIKSLVDSGVYVGVPTGQTGLPSSAAGINPNAQIDMLNIRGSSAHPYGLDNSYVVAGRLNTGTVQRVRTDNFGRAFGLAFGDVTALRVVTDGRDVQFGSTSRSPAAIGDFQVLLDFTAPTA